jgi:hypothetical protein
MATIPQGGYGLNETFSVTVGPFDGVNGVDSYAIESAVFDEQCLGSPLKSKASHTPGESNITFSHTAKLTYFNVGDILWIAGLPFEISSIWSLTEISVIDPDNILPLIHTNNEWGNYPDFFRGVSATHPDKITYTWSISYDGEIPISSQYSLSALSTQTFAEYSQPFYIILHGASPIAWQNPFPEPAAIYHMRDSIIMTYGATTSSGESSSSECEDLTCDDPFSVDGGAVIEVDCTENIFNPYAQNKSVNLYKQLNNIVSDMFGHDVNYFRTEPHNRTKDVTLMEYSLFDVADNQNVKILVPDNEFPSEANTYDIFGMEFAEFEVHIVHEKFQAVFGSGVRPRAKDYMFIPIINKMYEVSSVSIADEFNASRSYWRVKLTKYQDRSSVIKGVFDEATDNLITGIDEVFAEEIKDEQEKVTNPVQFQTVSRVLEDGSRTYIDSNLVIKDEAVVNNFMTVSNNHYDLSNVSLGATALKYGTSSSMVNNGQIGLTTWLRPTFEITDNTEYEIVSDNIPSGGIDIKISTLFITVYIDGVLHKFTHNTNLSKTKWYGLVVNIKNNTEKVQAALYSLDVNGHISSMVQEFTQEIDMVGGQAVWTNNLPYTLKGGKLNLTNIRIFDKAIESTEFENMLNQYVVHDNQHALVIDNAIPSLGYQKFKNAR